MIADSIRRMLRERKISYASFASELGISESGFKKIIASQDVSISRLSQMAQILDVRLSDLLGEVENAQMNKVEFAPAQQDFLIKNPSLFRLFVKISIEREPLESVQKEFKLSDADAFKMLRKLDMIGMLKLLPNGKIKLPKLSLVKDFGPGPLLQKTYREWGEALVADLADPKFQSSGQFIVRGFKLKDESYRELLARLLELEAEFLKRAVREMSVSTANLKSVRWMWLTDQQSFVKGAVL